MNEQKQKDAPTPEKRKIVVPIGRENDEIDAETLNSLEINKRDLKRLTQKKKVKGGVVDIQYTLYESSQFGRLANSFFEGLSDYYMNTFPEAYKSMKSVLLKSDIRLLSRTYVSVIFLSSFIALLSGFSIALLIGFFSGGSILFAFIRSIGIAVLACASTWAFVFYYPNIVVKSRNRAISDDLPFVIIHMSAVSGSGAQPISVFNLVLGTGEYKGLEREIRKIVNYVNLFGYDLTTALRTVAATTPSKRFRELLVGIVATLETGGDLRDYLQQKADDALTTYKLERKKYVDSLATYSDIYTGVLIAAPLLFVVTLAIINVLGGSICLTDTFCAEASTLAFIGTFFIIPFLNVFFLIFLNLIQPEV